MLMIICSMSDFEEKYETNYYLNTNINKETLIKCIKDIFRNFK